MAGATVNFTFNGEDLTVETAEYEDGSLAVMAVDADGLPYATLSVRMPGDKPPDGVFFLKTWSENERIAVHFLLSGLIEPAYGVEMRSSGYITANPYKFREVI